MYLKKGNEMSIREEARKKATEQYLKRLTELNVGAQDKTVLDSIDRPMRPLILELHRMGMETTFCCCGFPYEGEEEPKTHHRKFTYVFIKNKMRTDEIAHVSGNFIKALKKQGWDYNDWQSPKGEKLTHLFYRNPYPNLYNNDEKTEHAIHDYESQVLAIKRATSLAKQFPTLVDEIRIHDGNMDYFEAGYDEWQVEPKPDFTQKTTEVVTETGEN